MEVLTRLYFTLIISAFLLPGGAAGCFLFDDGNSTISATSQVVHNDRVTFEEISGTNLSVILKVTLINGIVFSLLHYMRFEYSYK